MPDPVAYAVVADFEAYVEGWVTDDEDALKRTLHRASLDVDRYIGPAWSVEDNGLRFGEVAGANPKKLEKWKVEALVRATCAQAEYRLTMGEEWFASDQHEAVGGPDFSTTGRLSRYGPKMREELSHTGLRRATGGRLIS